MIRRTLLGLVPALMIAAPALAQGQRGEVAVYSARHYDSDKRLYEAFTRDSGIRVRLIEGDADQLMDRIRNEGANSPADVLITVDAARLARAKEAGITQPVQSQAVTSRVPEGLRDPEGHWFAVSKRARVIMYDKQAGVPQGLARYEDLADPRFRGQVCVRAANHPYNVSLAASVLAAGGAQTAEAWARGVAANLARPPQGGDRDQFRAIPSGQCRLAIANTYYLAAFGASNDPADRALFDRLGVIFPNQGDRGTHVNISGAALVRTAPNRENALRFLEYMLTPAAQQIFALGNMEYPVATDAPLHPVLQEMGTFRAEPIHAAQSAANAAEALRVMQRAGWR
jgi:iron(III) transport system substrate-binding protein